MTDHTLPQGVIAMPGVDNLNEVLARGGLTAKILVVNRSAGLYFGRQQPAFKKPDHMTYEEFGNYVATGLETWERNLRTSLKSAANLLGVNVLAADTRPNITGISYTPRPQDLDHDQLVQQLIGPGFMVGENPHKPCLALLSAPGRIFDQGIVTPFADAPPLKLVYADVRNPGNPLVVTIDLQALWNRLPAPLGDQHDHRRANLIGRAFDALVREVAAHGYEFDINNVWSFTGPGANDTYPVDRASKYGELISTGDWLEYTNAQVVPSNLVREGGLRVSDTHSEVDSLRLRDWVHGLVTKVYEVPEEQAFVLEHDTVLEDRYASARKGELSGNAMLSVIARP